MVEQQVVGLKVVGSSPTIYLIIRIKELNKINFDLNRINYIKYSTKSNSIFNNKNIIKFYWYTYFYMLINWSYNHFYKNHFTLFNYSYVSLKSFNDKNDLLSYKSLHKLKLTSKNTNIYSNKLDTYNLIKFEYKKLFNIFLKTNITSRTGVFKVNYSWKSFFIDHGVGVRYILLDKLFIKFKMIINLINIIYFFNLKILYFSNAFFRDEVNSLNWSNFKNLVNVWRRVMPFFTFKFGRIFDSAWVIFYKLRLEGYYIALIIDLQYHIKNLYYLNRAQYYIIGFVPLWYNSNLVSFAVPTSNDGITSQLFVFRFLLLITKSSKKLFFLNNFKTWYNFKKLI